MSNTLMQRLAQSLLPVALPLLLANTGMHASAAPRLAAAGSLLCTTGHGTKTAAKVLSCTFDGIAGGDRGLEGHIVLKGGASLPPGKRVLMWSVLAPTTKLEPTALIGKFRETSPGRLVGGRDGSIVLKPATAQRRDAALTILQLRLDPIKA